MIGGQIMAYKKLEKGSEEWQFFKDYYEFRQKYYEADNSEEWFEKLAKKVPLVNVWQTKNSIELLFDKKIINLIKIDDLFIKAFEITPMFRFQSRGDNVVITLDSVKLAEEIQKRADHTINCFLQVNVSGEESKHGFSPEELDTVLNQIKNLDKICIVGLMTMAPIDANTQELDKIFAETNELRQSIQDKKLKNVPCDQLSMGMSRDYDMAIQNGSTFVRIGSAFFKENGE